MNTPSKEALEAAKELFPDAISFYRLAAENAAEIIDRHFEPLRQRLAEMESLLASEKTIRNAIIAKGQQAEARVKELQKQEAESRRLFYAEQDKRQSAEQRNAELEAALRGMIKNAERDGDTRLAVQKTLAVIARHATDEPEAQT